MLGVLCLVDCVYYKIKFGVFEVKWCSVCMFFYDVCEQVWEQIVVGNFVIEEIDMMFKFLVIYVVWVLMEVVNDVYQVVGMVVIQCIYCLQCIVCDVMVVMQYVVLLELNYESVGVFFVKLGIKC